VPARPPRKRYRDARDVGNDELLTVLRAHRFKLQPAAASLGISRTALYELIERSPSLRKAVDLDKDNTDALEKLGKVQVAEGYHHRRLLPDEPPQEVVVRIRPEMFVVGQGVGVNDQELVIVFADPKRKRQVLQPGRPAFPDFVPRPRNLCGLKLRSLLPRGIF